MKSQIKIISCTVFFIVSLFFAGIVNAQSSVIPVKISWKCDQNPVSLKTGFETGVNAPQNLSLEIIFNKNILKEIPKEKLSFEFRWFHYYSTRKDFMDSYTIPFDEEKSLDGEIIKISSTRGNISSGWWEVQIISKYDGKEVQYNDLKKFQIYIK